MKPCCIWAQYLTVEGNSGNKKSQKRQRIPPRLRLSLYLISTSMIEMLVLVEKRGILQTGQMIRSTGGRTSPFCFKKKNKNKQYDLLTMQHSLGKSFLFICSDKMRGDYFFKFNSTSRNVETYISSSWKAAQLQNSLIVMKRVSGEDRWRGRQEEKNFHSDRIDFILPTEIENRDERATAVIAKS